VKHKFNADVNDRESIAISKQICCQSIIILQAISCLLRTLWQRLCCRTYRIRNMMTKYDDEIRNIIRDHITTHLRIRLLKPDLHHYPRVHFRLFFCIGLWHVLPMNRCKPKKINVLKLIWNIFQIAKVRVHVVCVHICVLCMRVRIANWIAVSI